MPLRTLAPRPAFFSALPEELVLRVFSFLSVAELRNVCVNRKFLRLFHEPLLWKTRVEALLALCTLNARLVVQKSLRDGVHLWSAQLRHDFLWHSRLAHLPPSDALVFDNYKSARAHENTYKLMAQFEMVSTRHNASGVQKLSTIPFIQSIKNLRTGERMNIFRVSLLPDKYFIALCTWKYGLYDIVLNGTTMNTFCFLRLGDVLKMVRKKSGKTRQFSLQLAVESDILDPTFF
jgi:hypothetical protein